MSRLRCLLGQEAYKPKRHVQSCVSFEVLGRHQRWFAVSKFSQMQHSFCNRHLALMGNSHLRGSSGFATLSGKFSMADTHRAERNRPKLDA